MRRQLAKTCCSKPPVVTLLSHIDSFRGPKTTTTTHNYNIIVFPPCVWAQSCGLHTQHTRTELIITTASKRKELHFHQQRKLGE